jgi:hypothetical protein
MKCIVCEKNIEDPAVPALCKHDVSFCSENCLSDYEKKLAELAKVANWDNCC